MYTKRFDMCFKRWVQFRLGAIPCLPEIRFMPTLQMVSDLLVGDLAYYPERTSKVEKVLCNFEYHLSISYI